MGKRATSTVAEEIFQVEGFDVRFVGGEPESGSYVDPYPFERAANHVWSVKKWRTSRWEPTYPYFDVEVLDADGAPVHGKTLLSTVRATYATHLEPAPEIQGPSPAATLHAPAAAAVHETVGSPGVVKKRKSGSTSATDIYDVADRLWATADELRANSHLRAAEYSIPVLGLIFLKFADRRFTQAEAELEGTGTERRPITKANYQAMGVLYLPEAARFSKLLDLKEGDNLGKAINDAMAVIEGDNPALTGG